MLIKPNDLWKVLGQSLTVVGGYAQNLLAIIAIAVLLISTADNSYPTLELVFRWLVFMFHWLFHS